MLFSLIPSYKPSFVGLKNVFNAVSVSDPFPLVIPHNLF